MTIGFCRTANALRHLSFITSVLACLLLSGCGPSERELKEKAEQKIIEEREVKVEALRSKMRNTFRDPASTQFRNTKLLSNDSVLCGEVNSKNEYGGFLGFTRFAVNSKGKTILIEKTPTPEIITLSSKTKEERREYVMKFAVQFGLLGLKGEAIKMVHELELMESFGMDSFSLWGDCFS